MLFGGVGPKEYRHFGFGYELGHERGFSLRLRFVPVLLSLDLRNPHTLLVVPILYSESCVPGEQVV